ncbi:MAG: glycerophosphoryl diester phosphodiesterase membrane domain-containing protein [Deltaproteobacteria bacterium]|nr:glycerophosphoryl diester phosphodiesterase membrane domain-containing protein [Deltaproteobacteria bacterium]
MQCSNCGSALAPGQATCSACGLVVGGGASVGAFGERPVEARPMPPPGPYNIRFGVSEPLTETFRLWGNDLGRLVLMTLIPYGFLLPFGIGFGVWAAISMSSGGEPSTTQLVILGSVGFALAVVAGVLMLASSAGAMLLADDKERTGGTGLGVWQAFLGGLARSGWLILANLLYVAIIVVLWGVPFAVPVALLVETEQPLWALGFVPALGTFVAGVWLLTRLMPMLPLIVVEELSVGVALSRAWQLTAGRALDVFLANLVFGVALMGIYMAVGIISIIPLLGLLIQLAANIILGSLQSVYAFTLYAGLVSTPKR